MNTKLLIVEDDQLLRQAFVSVLTIEGFEVHAASNGREALEYLSDAETLPDVVVLDLLMPIMSGLEFLERFRSNKTFADVKLLILSNLSDEKTLKQLKSFANERYLLKATVSPRQLAAAIRNIATTE